MGGKTSVWLGRQILGVKLMETDKKMAVAGIG
jgi:hypothetical protein